jgi:hypothetical protein
VALLTAQQIGVDIHHLHLDAVVLEQIANQLVVVEVEMKQTVMSHFASVVQPVVRLVATLKR